MDAKDASGPPPILGVVIAGGLSSRMGREKALISLAGKPLLAHVLERFRPQVDCVALNANGDPSRFAAFALEVAPDRHADHPGPLAGLAAALHLALSRGYELVATAPSDAPFLPLDAVARLRAGLEPGVDAVVASGPNGLEPLVGLWRIGALDAIESALSEGRRAVHRLLAALPHRVVPFTSAGDGPDPFANLNTPEELREAERMLQASP